MSHKTIHGKIIYTSKKPDRMNEERGREHFSLTKQADDILVMHAHCEIDDAPNVIRDVVVSMDLKSRPLDAYVRLTVGDKFEGTGWFRFADTYVECESYNQKDGRIKQKINIPAPVKWLQAHPIVGDALVMKLYDLSQGTGKQFFPNLMLTSPDHRGATGPEIFQTGFGIAYLGVEEITVGAGTFSARHFQIVDTAGNLPEEHPPYNLWCTADDEYVFLRAAVGGYMQTHYELTELSRT